MSGFIEVLNIRKKMCQSIEICSEECPLYKFTLNNNLTGYKPCSAIILDHPEEAEKIILNWASEKNHLRK